MAQSSTPEANAQAKGALVFVLDGCAVIAVFFQSTAKVTRWSMQGVGNQEWPHDFDFQSHPKSR
jgi:hypothetical protein